MNADELRDEISEQCNDVSFNYNGKVLVFFQKSMIQSQFMLFVLATKKKNIPT